MRNTCNSQAYEESCIFMNYQRILSRFELEILTKKTMTKDF